MDFLNSLCDDRGFFLGLCGIFGIWFIYALFCLVLALIAGGICWLLGIRSSELGSVVVGAVFVVFLVLGVQYEKWRKKQLYRSSVSWFTAFPKTGAEEDETINAETPPPQPPITREEKAELRKLGWSINDILNMTPDEARDILKE